MPFTTIRWHGDLQDGWVEILDQTRLPNEVKMIEIGTVEAMWEAIRLLRIRGAPAIGIAGAMAMVLGMRHSQANNFAEFRQALLQTKDYLASSRPTAVNLFWALERMTQAVLGHEAKPLAQLKEKLFEEAIHIYEEDRQTCRQIGEVGEPLIPHGARVLTHCNAGALATAEYGTALAAIFLAAKAGKQLHVYADETRPLLQGARLTTWELQQAGIEVTLICDNTAAFLMQRGQVDLILVGADRIAANGDTANKIGTYNLAVLAQVHGIPFYVAAPISTFDRSTPNGAGIPIEERPASEITVIAGQRIAPEGVRVYAPAFDVTPAQYITGFVTEKGFLRPPFSLAIAQALRRESDEIAVPVL